MPQSKARALRRAKIRAFYDKYNVEPTFVPNFNRNADKTKVEKQCKKELLKEMKERGFKNINKSTEDKCDTSVFERMKRKNEEIRDEEFLLLHRNLKNPRLQKFV